MKSTDLKPIDFSWNSNWKFNLKFNWFRIQLIEFQLIENRGLPRNFLQEWNLQAQKRFLRDFLQKCKLEACKRSFSPKLPPEIKLEAQTDFFLRRFLQEWNVQPPKTKVFVQDSLQRWQVDHNLHVRITLRFNNFYVDAAKVLRLPRQSSAEAYGVREMIPQSNISSRRFATLPQIERLMPETSTSQSTKSLRHAKSIAEEGLPCPSSYSVVQILWSSTSRSASNPPYFNNLGFGIAVSLQRCVNFGDILGSRWSATLAFRC